MPIIIGEYQLKSKVLLAPMAGVSDSPFRRLCKSFGAGLVTSEMVVLQKHLLNSNKSKYRLDFSQELSPICVQIAGSSAKEMSHYAQEAVKFGADIVDINMGCPAKKVCNKLAGSALLKDEILVKNILNSVVGSIDSPVTLKIRTGWDENNKNAVKIAQIAQDAGVKMLSVHGRTRKDKYLNQAEYQTIKQVVKYVDIPVIANGDISSAKKAKQVLDYTGASGVMIGRASRGNPWLIREIDNYLTNGRMPKDISLNDKKKTIIKHVLDIYQFYGETIGIRIVRKHIFWYLQNFYHNEEKFWKKFSKISHHKEQLQILNNFLNEKR